MNNRKKKKKKLSIKKLIIGLIILFSIILFLYKIFTIHITNIYIKGNKELLEEVVRDRLKRRLESQPLEYPSAGSVFRNPKDNYSGKLIEDLGYKGLIKGGAKVSEKHANFVVNYNNATASDIKELICFLHDEVKDKYGIDLILEQELVNWE